MRLTRIGIIWNGFHIGVHRYGEYPEEAYRLNEQLNFHVLKRKIQFKLSILISYFRSLIAIIYTVDT